METPIYRGASFRGVPLDNVSEVSIETGRRGPLHEYVDRDDPYFDDTGQKPIMVSLSLAFRGLNHLTQAENLERTVTEPGGGLLVLPNRQQFEMVCTTLRRTENFEDEANQTRFELEFVPYHELTYPESIASFITDIVDQVFETINALREDVARIEGIGWEIAAPYFAAHGLFVNQSLGLVDEAERVASSEDAGAAILALSRISTDEDTPEPLRAVTALLSAQAFTRVELTTTRDLVGIRDTVVDALEQVIPTLANLESVSSNLSNLELVRALIETRFNVLADSNSRLLLLPTYREYSFGESQPSVVAAQMIYGDYSREEDLRDWNGAVHPLFMPLRIEAHL